MKRTQRLTLLVVLVFGGLLAFSVAINTARQTRQAALPTATPGTGYLFPSVEPSAITRITVYKGGAAALILTRAPGEWRAVDAQGAAIQVAPGQIARMIQILGTLRYNRMLQETNVSVYGLAGSGNVMIEFEAGVAGTHHLRIGDLAQYEAASTYVQRDTDSVVYMADSAAVAILSGALPGAGATP